MFKCCLIVPIFILKKWELLGEGYEKKWSDPSMVARALANASSLL